MKFKLPRFYPIIDTEAALRRGVHPIDIAEALADAKVGVAQYRHKGRYDREYFAQARDVRNVLMRAAVPLVINDRVDVALAFDAAGVHLGQMDLPPKRVRAIVDDSTVIGFSTHNERQLRRADREPVDYLAIGPIFDTGSKDNPDPVVGLEELFRLSRLTEKPLVAIGGITRANSQEVFQAGADSVAVISDLLEGDLLKTIAEWLMVAEAR